MLRLTQRILLFGCFAIVLISAVSSYTAQTGYSQCPSNFNSDSSIKYIFNKGVFIYLKDPATSPVNKYELFDLQDFIIQQGLCTDYGDRSHTSYLDIARKIDPSISGFIPSVDGSCYIGNEHINNTNCSVTHQPSYCLHGLLVQNSSFCGCIPGENIAPDGLNCIANQYNLNNCTTIDLPGTYVLNQSLINFADPGTGACINIGADYITLDCNNKAINSNLTIPGVYSNGSYLTIKNCNINMTNYYKFKPYAGTAISLEDSVGDSLFNNHLVGGRDALKLSTTSNSMIEANTLTAGRGAGINVLNSPGNSFNNNKINLLMGSAGIALSSSNYNSISSNVISGFYSVGGQSGEAIYIDSSNNSTIVNNDVSNNICQLGNGCHMMGIWLLSSSSNVVDGNIANGNGGDFGYGIYISDSNNNEVINNIANNNTAGGIFLDSSSNNNIVGNKVSSNNGEGLEIFSSANNNLVVGNNIKSNQYGLDVSQASGNNISLNSICYNNNTDFQSDSSNSGSGNYADTVTGSDSVQYSTCYVCTGTGTDDCLNFDILNCPSGCTHFMGGCLGSLMDTSTTFSCGDIGVDHCSDMPGCTNKVASCFEVGFSNTANCSYLTDWNTDEYCSDPPCDMGCHYDNNLCYWDNTYGCTNRPGVNCSQFDNATCNSNIDFCRWQENTLEHCIGTPQINHCSGLTTYNLCMIAGCNEYDPQCMGTIPCSVFTNPADCAYGGYPNCSLQPNR